MRSKRATNWADLVVVSPGAIQSDWEEDYYYKMYEDKYMDYKRFGLIQSYSEFVAAFETGPFSPATGGQPKPAGGGH